MFKALLSGAVLLSFAGTAQAQVMLPTYAGKNGYVDVQKLTCAQLANTFQEYADYLTVWYSVWYDAASKKTFDERMRTKKSYKPST